MTNSDSSCSCVREQVFSTCAGNILSCQLVARIVRRLLGIVRDILKAWLSLLGREYPRIHDLEQLFNLLEDQGIQIPAHFRDLTDLTEYSVQFRYEYLDETNDAIDRLSTISNVKELFDTVQSAVNKENRHR